MCLFFISLRLLFSVLVLALYIRCFPGNVCHLFFFCLDLRVRCSKASAGDTGWRVRHAVIWLGCPLESAGEWIVPAPAPPLLLLCLQVPVFIRNHSFCHLSAQSLHSERDEGHLVKTPPGVLLPADLRLYPHSESWALGSQHASWAHAHDRVDIY
jgi:hypothetical protein